MPERGWRSNTLITKFKILNSKFKTNKKFKTKRRATFRLTGIDLTSRFYPNIVFKY
jgi:hypothetical protein